MLAGRCHQHAPPLDPYTYLANNDSYHLFDQTGDLFRTGLTATNVMDIQLVLIDRR